MRMAGRIEFLFLDDLFLDEATAGSIGRDRNNGSGLGFRFGSLRLRLLLAAQAKEAKSGGTKRVYIVRGSCIGVRLGGNRFVDRWLVVRRFVSTSSCLVTGDATGSSAEGSSIGVSMA